MKNASVLIQFGLFIIGISLLFFYVRPAFSDISADQDTLSEYSNAITEATEVNQLLDNLVTSIENIPPADQEALDKYLPSKVDSVSVQRDLKEYVDQSPVLLGSLAQADGGGTSFITQDSNTADTQAGDGSVNPGTQNATLPVTEVHFSLSVTGDYSDIKNLLADIEMNSYPIHLQSIALSGSDAGDLQAEMTFVTYEFNDDQS